MLRVEDASTSGGLLHFKLMSRMYLQAGTGMPPPENEIPSLSPPLLWHLALPHHARGVEEVLLGLPPLLSFEELCTSLFQARAHLCHRGGRGLGSE